MALSTSALEQSLSGQWVRPQVQTSNSVSILRARSSSWKVLGHHDPDTCQCFSAPDVLKAHIYTFPLSDAYSKEW